MSTTQAYHPAAPATLPAPPACTAGSTHRPAESGSAASRAPGLGGCGGRPQQAGLGWILAGKEGKMATEKWWKFTEKLGSNQLDIGFEPTKMVI